MKSNNSKHSFSEVPRANIQRSSFDRSHGLKTTFDSDGLYPIMIQEVLPGDTHTVKANIFGRLATPINPIMDNQRLTSFFFFVPTRLVFDNFPKLMGEQIDPGDSIDYTIPTKNATVLEGDLCDYMGMPLSNTAYDFNVLPLRCYYKIWDEWFRDQNLQDSNKIVTDDTDGVRSNGSFRTILKRGKRHDYYTSCLTAPQKGVAVSLPLGLSANITTDAADSANLSIYSTVNSKFVPMDSAGTQLTQEGLTAAEGDVLYADLSNATAATINDLRTASSVQRMMETDARSGSRYTEKLKAHFGVTSPDFRLQRSEYLGGGTSQVNVTPIAQQSSTDATTPQGNLAAIGTVSGSGHGFTKSFTEHGYIIGLICATADLTYSQGLDRMWSRKTIYDFYFPGLAQLGEMAVLNKEIYLDGSAADENVFGYQEAFSDYRYANSKITGKFRSSASATLDSWHLSEEFGSLPGLNATFIESNTPLDRCIAVPAEPHYILDVWFNYTSVRPMPVHGIPGISKF